MTLHRSERYSPPKEPLVLRPQPHYSTDYMTKPANRPGVLGMHRMPASSWRFARIGAGPRQPAGSKSRARTGTRCRKSCWPLRLDRAAPAMASRQIQAVVRFPAQERAIHAKGEKWTAWALKMATANSAHSLGAQRLYQLPAPFGGAQGFVWCSRHTAPSSPVALSLISAEAHACLPLDLVRPAGRLSHLATSNVKTNRDEMRARDRSKVASRYV